MLSLPAHGIFRSCLQNIRLLLQRRPENKKKKKELGSCGELHFYLLTQFELHSCNRKEGGAFSPADDDGERLVFQSRKGKKSGKERRNEGDDGAWKKKKKKYANERGMVQNCCRIIHGNGFLRGERHPK